MFRGRHIILNPVHGDWRVVRKFAWTKTRISVRGSVRWGFYWEKQSYHIPQFGNEKDGYWRTRFLAFYKDGPFFMVDE